MKYDLINAQQAHELLSSLWPKVKAHLTAGNRLVLEVRDESKSRDQEKLYHDLIGQIAEQAKHAGFNWDAESWKRLLLAKFAKDTGRAGGKMIPSLDFDGVVEVEIKSRRFTKQDATEFIEWLYAWGAQNGVTFNE